MAPDAKREILLVGSVPLGSAEQVFATCAGALDGRVKRLPDGETGPRTNWIAWQRGLLADNPALRQLPASGPFPVFVLNPDHRGPVKFGPLGYAAAAKESYAVFRRLRAEGRVPPGMRFQVSLPTPLAVVAQYIEASAQDAVEVPYQARLLEEAEEIFAAIPAADLAVQWDVAVEFAVLEGLRRVHFKPVEDGVIARLRALRGMVPAEIEMGFHLCYGDSGGKHFKEPADMSLLVKVANAIVRDSPRAIQWIHMPVPQGRDDSTYFAPLKNLQLPPETRLFLGLVHHGDGIEGTRRRMAMAQRFFADFGIATECGFGRRPPETVPDLLRVHTEV
ncbi:MAG: hypothetical protein KIT16_16835 [Rhodospirillaceae bacterium]|nr:hypothetical protein [Rhodospirillaceae bacterium]